MTDLIDRIDELIDEQLAAGEPKNGYDYGDPKYPRCPHCGRHWHGLPITARIAFMYAMRRYDPEYSHADDDSPILCEGSDFIGPPRPPVQRTPRREIAITIIPAFDAESWDRFRRQLEQIRAAWDRMFVQIRGSWLIPQDPIVFDEFYRPPKPCPTPVDVKVEFGPHNWIHEIRRIPPERQFPRPWPRFFSPAELAVRNHWHQFTAPSFPVPPRPGYDFSHYTNDTQPTWVLTADHNARPQTRPARTSTRQHRRGRTRR